MADKYRPSNGDAGIYFMAKFCDQCIHMREDGRPPCGILGLTMGYDEDDPEYPAEWTYAADGSPVCTAFKFDDGQDDTPPYRCPETPDLFG